MCNEHVREFETGWIQNYHNVRTEWGHCFNTPFHLATNPRQDKRWTCPDEDARTDPRGARTNHPTRWEVITRWEVTTFLVMTS